METFGKLTKLNLCNFCKISMVQTGYVFVYVTSLNVWIFGREWLISQCRTFGTMFNQKPLGGYSSRIAEVFLLNPGRRVCPSPHGFQLIPVPLFPGGQGFSHPSLFLPFLALLFWCFFQYLHRHPRFWSRSSAVWEGMPAQVLFIFRCSKGFWEGQHFAFNPFKTFEKNK